MLSNSSVQKAERQKLMTRITAENSIWSVVSFCLNVLSEHFLLGESLEQNAYDKLPT